MTAHEEIELKLRVDPDNIVKIRRSGWWRELGRARQVRLHSVYFDTPDQSLRDLNVSLRTRTDCNTVFQTVKLAGNGSGPVSRREWETLMPDVIPDPSLVIDPALPQAFRELTAADLRPVFDVDVKRDTRLLESDQAKIELSLDEGAVTSGRQRENIHEIELELVSGSVEELFAEARRLSEIADGRLHTRTKSDLGYALVAGARMHWSRAPKLHLAAEMTAGEALKAIVRNCFAHLTSNDDCARLNLHPEGVHQCRIALRRLRSVLRIYAVVVRRKRIEPIEAEVRWLGAAMGSARDLDVLQTDLLEPAIDALGDSEQLAPLMSGLERKKSVAYAAVREALSSERYRNFLIDLCVFGHGDCRGLGKSGDKHASLDQPLPEFATLALAGTHRKLLKRARNFENLSNEERHSVRIALKRMRYAVDFFRGAFDGDRHKRFFKSLARLQDDLGRMNDVTVAEAMLARLVGVEPDDNSPSGVQPDSQGKLAFAAGCVLGWHRRRAAEIDERLIKDWHAFAAAKPFWQGEAEAATAESK